jgi:hypothetical protein
MLDLSYQGSSGAQLCEAIEKAGNQDSGPGDFTVLRDYSEKELQAINSPRIGKDTDNGPFKAWQFLLTMRCLVLNAG